MNDINWLLQYIREAQVRYPSISNSPVDVLSHMLFTNGNGVEMEEGNFVVKVDYNRSVAMKDYYKNQRSFQFLKEYIEEYKAESEIQSISLRNKTFNRTDLSKTDDEFWEEAVEKFNRRYKGMIIIDSLATDCLTDISGLVRMIKTKEYDPYLGLSKGYYKLYHFCEKTDKGLVEVGLAMCKAYIEVLTGLVENPVLITNSPSQGAWQEEITGEQRSRLVKTYLTDLELLTNDVVRLKGYLNN